MDTPGDVQTDRRAHARTHARTHAIAVVSCQGEDKFKDGVDYFGSDLMKGFIVSNASDCCSKYLVTAGCKYWTFGTDNKKCWLKPNMNGKLPKSTRVSGTMVEASGSGS